MAYNRSKQITRIYINGNIFKIDNINKNEYEFVCKIQKERLVQVWIIIINNALDELIKIQDYEKRALYINIEQKDESIITTFKDNAGGINDDILDNIFDPFVSSKQHSGMGVGLNIAKKIIDQQNGELIAYNEDDGAVFQITLKKV
ncbi:MAG: ATP-binding protein, partial [Poseidonibacter sp.]|uniref:ATP-binding protein n=1 Tax=Poseidonibacter sp. TaxID=2321188 RepID=UPI00359D4AC4